MALIVADFLTMQLLLNLALPWILLAAVGFLQPGTLDPNSWMLQGLQGHMSLFGITALTQQWGVLGLFIPLVVVHNVSFLVVRVIQKRVRMDFLPMIRSVLLWSGVTFLLYCVWASFNRGALFGEFHAAMLMLCPLFAICIGLAFFVKNDRSMGPAQLVAFMVAWSPLFSIVATIAGNHLRPPSLFSEVIVEPGADVQGWDALDAKTRMQGFLRLILKKEGIPVMFPSLARNLRVDFTSNQKVLRVESALDPIAVADLLKFPLQLEVAGWRPKQGNLQRLKLVCSTKNLKNTKVSLQWTKSDTVLALKIKSCAKMAHWSMESSTSFFSLGALDNAVAQKMSEQRARNQLQLGYADQSLLSHPDWRQRKLGFALLSQVNDPAAIPLLTQGFYDRDVEVRRAAAVGLLSWGSKVEAFLAKALNDPSPYMRGDALRILALANRHQPHPAAFKMLLDSSNYVRVSAAQALAPFVKDKMVLKNLVNTFESVYKQAQKSSSNFLEEPFHAELVIVLASAQDVRTASVLLTAMPKVLSNHAVAQRAQQEAAHSLRNMENWMGVDYLQALARRSINLESREKALSIMARWREAGDEAVFLKALNDSALRPHALSLAPAFKSEAVTGAIRQINESELGAR